MIRIYYSPDIFMVREVQSLLEDEGIESIIFDDESYRLSIPMSAVPAAVWILDNAKKVDALALISDFEDKYKCGDDIKNDIAQQPSWVCDACGEKNDGNFFACWNCGKNLKNGAR